MGTLMDLTGMRFDRWTVIERAENQNKRVYWKCKCDCGTTKNVCGSFLVNGRSKSCGCITKERIKECGKNNSKDITGSRYGHLVALEPTDKRFSNGSIKWKCQCDCGNICYLSSSELKRRKSCGCVTKLNNISGMKFGKLTVISRADSKNNMTYWHCLCDCGIEKDVLASHLTSGKIVSCGCLSAERIANLNRKHGMGNTRIYKIWCGMKTRCYNKNSKSYENYGGRGITVCDEWIHDFMNFYDWAMLNGYTDELSIDRIDNDGNYEPKNCRWTTHKEQSNNTRRTRLFLHNGVIKSLKQIATDENIDYKMLARKMLKQNAELNSVICEMKNKRKE